MAVGKDFNDMSFSKVHYMTLCGLEYTMQFKQQRQLSYYNIASMAVGKGLIRLSVRLIMGGLEYTYVDNKPSS